LKDDERTGRPSGFDREALQTGVENNPVTTVRELAQEFDVSHMTIHRHLKSLGKVVKLGKWVPHELSPAQLQHRVDVCISLHSRHLRAPFLNQIVTGDEKWVQYKNIKRHHQWLSPGEKAVQTPTAGLHPMKTLLCVWWDIKGVIHFEMLGMNETITAALYCQQLDRLMEALRKKRPALVNRLGVLFHQDNARPHTARTTSQKLEELGWEKMSHPPYSPDLAPTDYHLFRSLQNHLDGKSFNSQEDVQTAVTLFFDSKSEEFFRRGIHILPERWLAVINNEGKYINV